MNQNNPLYLNQGIHVISAIFTVDSGKVKVLLTKRTNEPFKGSWILVGGACFNNENIDDAMRREINEKTGVYDIYLEQFRAFGKPYRAPVWRMLAVGYIGVLRFSSVKEHIETRNTSDLKWFEIDKIPKLGFDHEEILAEALEVLKKKILQSNILKVLFDEYFTLPELQKTYEIILSKKFDRRNFRKKFLSLGLIVDSNQEHAGAVGKPAKLYQFSSKVVEKDIF